MAGSSKTDAQADAKPHAPSGAQPDATDAPHEVDALPSIDFTTFVASLVHSAMMHLGDAPPLEGHPSEQDFPLARQTIDLLGVLEEKTRGNLTGEEERLLSHSLFDLRTRFVELSKAAAAKSGQK